MFHFHFSLNKVFIYLQTILLLKFGFDAINQFEVFFPWKIQFSLFNTYQTKICLTLLKIHDHLAKEISCENHHRKTPWLNDSSHFVC